MMKFFGNRVVQIILRLIVGGLFIYAASGKLFNQEAFARAIYNYKFLPDQFVNILAIVLPYIELFAGLFLIIGIYKRGSVLLIGVMLIVFIFALTRAYMLGLDISCGCFSLETVSQKSDILQRIIEDALLLIACVIIFINTFEKKSNKIIIEETP